MPKSEINDGQYYGQITYEKAFKSKDAAANWVRREIDRLEQERKVDSISHSIWEPS